MNIKQLRYILSVDESRHFERAAEKCFISQSTLSTMIGKFEDEIDIKVFDRKSKPVRVTEEGKVIITKIRRIIKEVEGLDNLVQELKGEMRGKITIGVIPTIAPYLLPRFVPFFARRFPGIHISIKEMTTENILRELLNRQLDIGIAAIPLENKNLVEIPLYNEPFVLYNSRPMNTLPEMISISQIDFSHFWLLEEGHCMRTQVESICELSTQRKSHAYNFDFKAGSIDSLIRFTKLNKGMTILPYLSTLEFNAKEKKKIRYFKSPKPMRNVGLLVHEHFVKKQLLKEMESMINEVIDPLFSIDTSGDIISPI